MLAINLAIKAKVASMKAATMYSFPVLAAEIDAAATKSVAEALEVEAAADETATSELVGELATPSSGWNNWGQRR